MEGEVDALSLYLNSHLHLSCQSQESRQFDPPSHRKRYTSLYEQKNSVSVDAGTVGSRDNEIVVDEHVPSVMRDGQLAPLGS